MNRLNEIEARANAATPGPWEAGCNDRHMHYVTTENEEFCQTYGPELYDSQGFFSDDDTAFIAHARTDVPALVAALKKVLELHIPDYTYPDCPKCAECSDLASTEARRVAVTWPCPTVDAIRQHLGDDL